MFMFSYFKKELKTNNTDKIKELIFRKVYSEIVNLENRKSAVRYRIEAPQLNFDEVLDEMSLGKVSNAKSK